MPKLDVIKVEWVTETEVHIYPPDGGSAWWARPVRQYFGDGQVWELFDGRGDEEVYGYLEDEEAMFKAVSEEYDGAPVIVTRERDQ
jgi:hypothetical protein